MDAASAKTWTENATKENPRWTRCRVALGREPKVYEFMIWNSRCWQQFSALHGRKDAESVRLKLGTDTDSVFDMWQADGVRAGKWTAV